MNHSVSRRRACSIDVAYYQMSTDRKGASGLGLDAQRADDLLFSEFTEIESGRNNNRPQLRAALDGFRRRRAVLLIACLDRLARNVAFISNLMDLGVEFGAVDMPTINRLTIHIRAVGAEHEREMISQRTKASFAHAKACRTRPGNP